MADALSSWWEGLRSGIEQKQTPAPIAHMLAFGQGARAVGEGAVVGSVLGAINAVVPGGLDRHVGMLPVPVPIDGAAAGLALLACLYVGSNHAASVDMANIAGDAMSVFMFRKSQDFIHARQAGPSIQAALAPKPAALAGEGMNRKSRLAGEFGTHGKSKIGTEFGAEDEILKVAFDLDRPSAA